eukprot:scaffold113771_cov18-Tisochrysis_lutea.AAC.2
MQNAWRLSSVDLTDLAWRGQKSSRWHYRVQKALQKCERLGGRAPCVSQRMLEWMDTGCSGAVDGGAKLYYLLKAEGQVHTLDANITTLNCLIHKKPQECKHPQSLLTPHTPPRHSPLTQPESGAGIR